MRQKVKALHDELKETRSALGKPTLVEVIRKALLEYVAGHRSIVQAVKRARGRYQGGSAIS